MEIKTKYAIGDVLYIMKDTDTVFSEDINVVGVVRKIEMLEDCRIRYIVDINRKEPLCVCEDYKLECERSIMKGGEYVGPKILKKVGSILDLEMVGD